jgi:DNA end-binding protein Ku
MSARAIASGTITFGLVSIPVKLYSATNPQTGFSFNLLHKKCGSRLKQQYICPVENEKVEREDMVKGYEYTKDRYVQFTPEELKAIEEKSTQSIEISEFVPVDKIDPIYYDKPYYLGPDKGGDKAYRLLAEVMLRTGRSALAKYAARGKQYLVLLRAATGGRLIMQQLLYADEVRSPQEIPIPGAELKDAEVALAQQLVDQISSEHFRPEQYEDEVRGRLADLVQRKVEGQDITSAPPEPGRAQVIDLMEALKASLLAKKGSGEAPAGASAGRGEGEEERKPAKRAAARGAASSGDRAKAGKK